MEQLAKVLIYIHAFFGGIGLISGLISIFVEKGGIVHRRSGTIFSYSMVISALLSPCCGKDTQSRKPVLVPDWSIYGIPCFGR